MDPKLKVFLSSAQYQDEFLVEREVLPILFSKDPLKSLFVIWRIEDTSSPMKANQQYISNVQTSDLMILLLGKTLRPDVKTEFEEALKYNIPVFAFIKYHILRDNDMQQFIDD